jgi:uncharacterized protein with PQ loop repeat
LSEELAQHALGVVGTALYIARAIPSTAQVIRTRHVDQGGVVGLDLLTISGIWWVVYALEIDNYPVLISSAAGLLPALATLVILWHAGRLHGRGLRLLIAGVALIPIAIADQRLAAVTAAVLGALIAVPEAISLARDPERADEDIDLLMWVLVAVNAVVWLAYGIMVEHPVLGLAGLIQLPTALLVCWRALRARPPRRFIQRGSPSAQLPD